MHRANHKRVATLAVIAIGVAALAGCTMVGDNVTGVDLNRGGPTTCVKQCNDAYQLLYKQEQKRHQEAHEVCQALPVAQQQACQAAESATHEANKDGLTEGKIDCQNNCHRQGTGSAG